MNHLQHKKDNRLYMIYMIIDVPEIVLQNVNVIPPPANYELMSQNKWLSALPIPGNCIILFSSETLLIKLHEWNFGFFTCSLHWVT